MGSNQSRSVSVNNIANEVITQTTMSNITNCSGNASQEQNVKVSDIVAVGCNVKLGGKQEADLKYNFSCIQDNANTMKLQQDFQNNLKSTVESAARSIVNVGSNESKSENYNDITNKITTQTDFKNFASCVANSFQTQNQEVKGLKFVCKDPTQVVDLTSVSQKLIGDVSQDCFQKNNNSADVIQKLSNDLTAETTSKAEGLALPDFDKMWADLMKMLIAIGPIAAVLVVLISVVCLLSSAAPILMKMMPKGSGNSSSPSSQYSAYSTPSGFGTSAETSS
ncbi:hypothetical protein EB118_03145 [bacterium]|nr:hypothetical protein [bacterium]NDC93960.1 hypothetical protein [bacterium]NDD83455.1 hypothetical protein [bacterium]NDG29080.1 hypothetical protein [bacterium]